MQIIIDIPDGDYKFIKDLQFYNSGRRCGRTIEQNVILGIRNGIPYEPKRDLISREALKKELNSRVFQDDYATTLLLSSFSDIIDNAPSIPLPDFKEGYKQAIIDGKTNFSRPQGEWIPITRHNLFGEDVNCYKCSICEKSHIPLMMTLIFEKIPFCPNCGADMRKGGTE